MIIKVDVNNVKIKEQDTLNSGEYNIHDVNFEFSEEYEGLVKKAVFSNEEHSYQVIVEHNKCIMPYEILEKDGNITIGLYAYEVDLQEDELKLRYSPKPITKYINIGSYKEHYDNYEEITPTDKQQIEQELNNISNQMDNLNIEAEKVDTKTTITITHKDGTTEEVEILDGAKGDKGDKGEPGAIKMLIVAELPTTGQEDTIYLVPLETPDISGNNYAEYVYINGAWELLGKIGVQVDLTDYYTKTETDTLLGTKQNTIDVTHKLSVDLVDGAEKTANKVTSISSSSTDTQYPSAKCVFDIVGNVESILEELDIGGGV